MFDQNNTLWRYRVDRHIYTYVLPRPSLQYRFLYHRNSGTTRQLIPIFAKTVLQTAN